MFIKYNSIENSDLEKFLDKIKEQGYWNDEFIVQEKIHGANFSYWTTDGQQFNAAKRTGNIMEGEVFFNYESVLPAIKHKLTALWEHLKADLPNLTTMSVFGELLGGSYPHPKVPVVQGAILVQKGIFYAPNNRFQAYDILINTEKFLDVEVANGYFERHDLPHAKTLFKGSMSQCLEYPNAFDSTLPKEFGLPEIGRNTAEGVVIRPLKTSYLLSGKRLILKNKNEKWSEKKKIEKPVKESAPLPEKVAALMEVIASYVTENRFENVLSKIGEVSPNDFGRVMGLFSKDVIEDFLKDHGDSLNDLEKSDRKMVTKSFSAQAALLIKKRLNN